MTQQLDIILAIESADLWKLAKDVSDGPLSEVTLTNLSALEMEFDALVSFCRRDRETLGQRYAASLFKQERRVGWIRIPPVYSENGWHILETDSITKPFVCWMMLECVSAEEISTRLAHLCRIADGPKTFQAGKYQGKDVRSQIRQLAVPLAEEDFAPLSPAEILRSFERGL